MALAIERLGSTYAGRRHTIDTDRALAYAHATNDDNPAYRSGLAVPPVFAAVPAWDALQAAVAGVVPPESRLGVVHAGHDIHFIRPLVAGMAVDSQAEAFGVRVGRSGTRYTVRLVTTDAGADEVVVEQYATLFVRGTLDGGDAGPEAPGHGFPEEARAREVARHRVRVDADQTFRYRDASGDRMPIHTDVGVARSVGLPGIVVHGLCTMAMTSQAVVRTVTDVDPTRLARLAVRFAHSVLPGHELATTVYDVGPVAAPLSGGPVRAYAFEAHSDGQLVVADGRAEVRA